MKDSRYMVITLLCLLLTGRGMPVFGKDVRVSFLDDEPQRVKALEFLSSQGFSQKAIGHLRSAMRSYYSEPFQMSMSNFPPRVNGTYSFRSGEELVASLPHKLCEAKHEYQINCFDTALILAEQDMRTDLRLMDQGHVLLAPWNSGRGSPQPIPAACAYDAFRWSYPEWYVTGVVHAVGMEWDEKRICLTVGLYSFKVLPWATQESGLEDAVLAALRAQWNAQGYHFPKNYEVVLGHNLDMSMKRGLFLTEHAGLLFHDKSGFTYFEKAGGLGPFVMLNFKEMTDLVAWYEGTVSDGRKWGYTHHFMTFNDTRIKHLRPQHDSAP